jgi:hypothetical protein
MSRIALALSGTPRFVIRALPPGSGAISPDSALRERWAFFRASLIRLIEEEVGRKGRNSAERAN